MVLHFLGDSYPQRILYAYIALAGSSEESLPLCKLAIVWDPPAVQGYLDTYSLLIGWCETKRAIRHSRTERVLNTEVNDEAVPA